MQPILLRDIAKPGARSAQAVVLKSGGHRLLIAQQVGLRPDGTLEKGLKAQLERAWLNTFSVIEAAGFRLQHLVRTTTYVTEPGRMLLVRETRERLLQGHPCLATTLQVSALQLPGLLCEIEAEASKDV